LSFASALTSAPTSPLAVAPTPFLPATALAFPSAYALASAPTCPYLFEALTLALTSALPST